MRSPLTPAALAFGAVVACVPTGTAPPYDAGPQPTLQATFKPSTNIMTQPFEDNFDRPDGGLKDEATTTTTTTTQSADATATTSLTAALDAAIDGQQKQAVIAVNEGGSGSDALSPLLLAAEAATPPERPSRPSNLGSNWTQMRTSAWRVENGRLCGEGAHNHGIWLNRVLPVNARIEFDAMALTEEGDLKAEVWGDGHSYATGSSYTNATSYLAVLGGWKNTLHVLARINEHGTDRKEIKVDPNSDDARQRAAVRGQLYQFKIERTDGRTIRWSVNGIEYLSWNDPTPLAGQGHDHFGFNEWEAKVCFDNVKVTPL